MTVFASRRNRLRKLVHQSEADALLVTNFKNVTYLTGFTGDDSFLLVTADGETLISDKRYTTQLEHECPGLKLEIREPGERMVPVTARVVEREPIKRLGIEADSATVALERSLAKALPKVELVATDSLVERLRIVKDKDEIEQTRLACRQAERAYRGGAGADDARNDRIGRRGGARIPGPPLRRQGAELPGDRRRRPASGAAPCHAHGGETLGERLRVGRLGCELGPLHERLDADHCHRLKSRRNSVRCMELCSRRSSLQSTRFAPA